jgi:uncharacterized protein YbaR (Trm112 family)
MLCKNIRSKMTQITRHFYRPLYEGFFSCCGTKLTYRIKDEYPKGINRIVCPECKKQFNVKFFQDDKGVMVLELREFK